MSGFRVPTVDLSAYVEDGSVAERASVAASLDAACRDVGFVQVAGHRVPDAIVADLAEAMDAFFAGTSEKARWIRPPAENRGYTPPRSESLSRSAGVESAPDRLDLFEAYNVGATADEYADAPVPGHLAHHYAENTWPDVDGFAEAVSSYFGHARRVARTLTTVFEDALALPRGFFDALTRHPVNVLRLNHYALPAGTELSLDGDVLGMGEHTDYGIVTVLWADPEPGLQVLSQDGVWHDVQPESGCLLVNLGDLTTRLTNERWLSTLHRVKPPVVDGTVRRRRSAAFFHDGDAEAVIGPLPAFVDDDHPPLYADVTVDQHVRAKLAGSRAGVLNAAAGRERARVRDAARPARAG